LICLQAVFGTNGFILLNPGVTNEALILDVICTKHVMVEMVDVSIPVLPVKRLLFQYSYTNTETQHSMYIDKLLSRLGPEWSLSNLRLPFKGPIPDDSSTNYILCFMVPQLKKVHVVTGPQRLLT